MAAPATTMAYNKQVEVFRDIEYPMMIGKTYLDHGGTTIYAKSVIDEFSSKMITNLFGNPHSASAPAMLSGHMVDSIRLQALAFFNADPEHFDLIFTQNATASIKLVGEAFRDLGELSSTGTFLYCYHKDCHTSIAGVRELTTGTHYCFTTDEEAEEWLDKAEFPKGVSTSDALPCLFAYPGQSNMTGRRLPLAWAKKLRQSNAPTHQNAYALLDAAALATTTPLDLSDGEAAPDFVALSFYKIFGFPDLGALIVRKKSGHILSWRKYFGGGTINGLTVIGEATCQKKHATLHDNLEDGTLPFHNIIALGCAIEVHNRLYGSMKRISQHTSFLAYRLYHGMTSLVHYNGQPLCTIYNDVGDRCTYGDPVTQGATIAFNLVRSNGKYVGYTFVENQANDRGIFLRSGGLCNAGGITSYLKIEPWQFKRAWSQGHRCGEPGLDSVNGKPTGVVRVSLGAMTTMKDIDTFLAFLDGEFLETDKTLQLTKFDDLSVHWGLETMPSPSHDSGFNSASGSDRYHGGVMVSQTPLRNVASSSNLKTTTKPQSPTQLVPVLPFYGHVRPGTANNDLYSQYQASAATLQRRHDTATTRHMVPVDSMRLYDAVDPNGFFPNRSEFFATAPDIKGTGGKKSGQKKFWKGRKVTF